MPPGLGRRGEERVRQTQTRTAATDAENVILIRVELLSSFRVRLESVSRGAPVGRRARGNRRKRGSLCAMRYRATRVCTAVGCRRRAESGESSAQSAAAGQLPRGPRSSAAHI